jgi:hypothetical protein
MHRIVTSIVLVVLISEVLPTPALPAARTSLQKSGRNEVEDDEPLYAYVYEYEEESSDQIWSDCSKLHW